MTNENSTSGDGVDAADLATVKGRLNGAFNRLIDKASPEELTVHMETEWPHIWGDLKRMAARDVARDLYEQQAFDPPPTHPSLADELTLDEVRRTPLITDTDRDEREGTLLWDEQSLVIVARFKTGKTTLLLNLIRSLVDGTPFLDHFKVMDIDGSVGMWNFELPAWQWREWASEHTIKNTDKVSLMHLRGYSLDLMRDHDAEWAVSWLREHEVKVWILDTWNAALNGIEENDNTRGGEFYRRVQLIARRAGVRSVIWTTQQGTGDGNDSSGPARARGATALMDNVDVFWTYKKAGDERFLTPSGRDVDYPEFSVTYDDWQHRVLAYGEEKSGKGADRRVAVHAYKPLIRDYLTNLPTSAMDKERNTGGVSKAVGDEAKSSHASQALNEMDDALEVHHLHGARRAKLWWIGPGNVTRPCTEGDCGKGKAEKVTPKKKGSGR